MRGSIVKRQVKTEPGRKPRHVYYCVVADGDKRKWHGDPDTGSGFTRREKAEAHLQDLLVSVRTGTYVEPSTMTVQEWSTGWLKRHKDRVRPSTWHGYETKLRVHVWPYIGDVKLQQLRPVHLDDLYATLRESGKRVKNKPPAPLSTSTVHQVHTILGECLGDAVRKGVLARNPQEAATAPKISTKADGTVTMNTWSATQVATFLDRTSDHRHHALWAFLLLTGCRRGEALGLRWVDVDLDRARANVQQTIGKAGGKIVVGTTKSGAGRRPVALDTDLVRILSAQKIAQDDEKALVGVGYDDHGLVFANPDGTPLYPEGVSRMFGEKAEKAGLPKIRLHDCRHTWATLALQAGVHPKVVQERLGHANVSITLSIYSHVAPSMHDDAAEVVAGVIRAAKAPNVVPLRDAR